MAGFIIRIWTTYLEPLAVIQIIPQIYNNIVIEWNILFGIYGGCAFGYM